MFTDDDIIKGLQYADSVRHLNEKVALKIALALAGVAPSLYTQLYNVVRLQNAVPASTLVLDPVQPLKVVK